MAAWIKKSWKVFRIVGPGVIIGLFLFFLWTNHKTIFEKNGFSEVGLPSDFYGPGTINTVEILKNNKLQLHPTCKVDVNEGITSTTIDIREEHEVKKGFYTKILKKFNLNDISVEKVRRIAIRLQNTKVRHIDDATLINIQKTLPENCQEAIKHNIESGSIVCQTRSVLKADGTYVIAVEETVSGGDPNVAARGVLREKTVAGGKDLFYGIRFLPFGIIPKSPESKPISCKGIRHI